jgi:hypothetical protein
MNTDGPAISFLTSCCDLPQNEQYRTFSLEPPFFSGMGAPGKKSVDDSARHRAVQQRKNSPFRAADHNFVSGGAGYRFSMTWSIRP